MDTGRLEAFSDGVFAFAITLLVLSIQIPSPDAPIAAELVRLWPAYLAYTVSFLLVGAIWVNHHVTFRHIVRVDGTLLMLNLLQLMVFAFVPFPTAVLAEAYLRGNDEAVAAAFYSGTLALGGIFVSAVWKYAAHGHRLLGSHLSPREERRIGRRYLVGPAVYLIGIPVALFAPALALVLFVLTTAFFLWPSRVDEVAQAGTGLPH